MKNIKKLLSEQADAVLPDKEVKQKVMRELGLQETEAVLAPAHGGGMRLRDKRKILIPAAAALLAIALFLCIFLPIFLGKGSGGLNPGGNKFAEITDADSFYAYGAASVGSLLASSGDTATAQSKALSSVRAVADAKSEADDARVETLNRYMTLVEGLLSEGSIVAESAAGGFGYEFGMTVKLNDLLGGGAAYTFTTTKFSAAESRTATNAKKATRSSGYCRRAAASTPWRAITRPNRKTVRRKANCTSRRSPTIRARPTSKWNRNTRTKAKETKRKPNRNTYILFTSAENSLSAPRRNTNRKRANSNCC